MMHFHCPLQFHAPARPSRRAPLWALTLSGVLLVACGSDQAREDVKTELLPEGRSSGLKVNGEAVPQLLLEAYARKRGWRLTDPSQLAQVREKTAELVAMAQAARDRGLLDDPQVQADLAFERLSMIAGRLIEQVTSEPLSEDQLRAEYQRELAELGEYEYRVAHMLFDDEAAARTVTAEALAGDFDALMAHYQDQPGVRDARELGWIKRPQLPEALRLVVDAATPGQTLDQPIKSEFGWHVLRIYERRSFEAAPFERLREGMINAAQRKRALEFSREVVEAAKIEGG